MTDPLKTGDIVEWKTPQGKTSGVIRKKLVAKTKIKSHVVAASNANPEFLVQSDKSGAVAAHKPTAPKKKRRP